MKKIIVILVLCLLFACNIFISPKKEFTLKDYFDSGILYTYTSYPINETSIELVDTYMSTSTKGCNKDSVIGECLYFQNLEVNSALKTLKAKVKFTEYIESQHLTIIYAYSSLIPKHKTINNYKINLQISTCSEYSAIGWPVIYGSF